MPKLNTTEMLSRVASIVGICTGALVIIGASMAWVSGIAFSAEVEALEEKHDQDIKELKVFTYQKDIDALTLKPNKTQYDRDRLNLWRHKIEQIKK